MEIFLLRKNTKIVYRVNGKFHKYLHPHTPISKSYSKCIRKSEHYRLYLPSGEHGDINHAQTSMVAINTNPPNERHSIEITAPLQTRQNNSGCQVFTRNGKRGQEISDSQGRPSSLKSAGGRKTFLGTFEN